MYTITCKGGYPVPFKSGMMQIVGYSCAVNSASTAARLTLVDKDPLAIRGESMVADSAETKGVVIDHKGMASVDNTLTCMFPEPLKVVNGLSVMNVSNLLPGKILIYIK